MSFGFLQPHLTILLLGVCFLYRPELLKWYLRESMGLIEMASGMLPYPWGDQIEIILREIGGSVWFQITEEQRKDPAAEKRGGFGGLK
jgi:hypothetical protein